MRQIRQLFPTLLIVLGGVVCLQAQNNRAPRLSNPDLMPPERAEEVNKRLDPVYDRAKDETTFFLSGLHVVANEAGREVQVAGEQTRRFLPASVIKMVVYYKFKGKTKAHPEELVIAFNAGNASGYEFLEHRKLKLAFGNETLDLGDMNLTGKSYDGFKTFGFIKYWETLEIPIKTDLYKRLVNSTGVSMQIGDATASLSGEQLKQLKGIAAKYLD